MKSKNRCRMLLILVLALSISCTARRSISDGETLRWGQSLEPEHSPQVDWQHMAMSAVQVCRNYDPVNGPSLLNSRCSTGIVLKDGYVLATLHALGYIDQIRPKYLPKDKVLVGSVIQENYGVLIPSIRKGKTGEFRSPPTFNYDMGAATP